MTRKQMRELKTGDIVRLKVKGEAFVVTANYGDHVTVVRTYDLTNPTEWDVVMREDRS